MSLIIGIFHTFLNKKPIWQDSCIIGNNFKNLIKQN